MIIKAVEVGLTVIFKTGKMLVYNNVIILLEKSVVSNTNFLIIEGVQAPIFEHFRA